MFIFSAKRALTNCRSSSSSEFVFHPPTDRPSFYAEYKHTYNIVSKKRSTIQRTAHLLLRKGVKQEKEKKRHEGMKILKKEALLPLLPPLALYPSINLPLSLHLSLNHLCRCHPCPPSPSPTPYSVFPPLSRKKNYKQMQKVRAPSRMLFSYSQKEKK